MKKVIIITGPTAIGKTKLSIELAKRLNTELINGDAYQIYKGLNILTAKPSIDELSMVKHHLMDVLEPGTDFTICQYQKMVRELIEKMELPIIVGGSGLYIDSVIYDYRFLEEDNSYEESDLSNEELHQILTDLDPQNALKIHPNNRKRLLRAIHLAKTQNKDERSLNKNHYYQPLIICLTLDRDILYERINQRVALMINEGMIEEVKENLGLENTQQGKAIGYIDTIKYLNNEITIDELIEKMSKDTRHYAKRQITWYRNHQDCVNLNVDLDNFDNTINEALKLIEDFLKECAI